VVVQVVSEVEKYLLNFVVVCGGGGGGRRPGEWNMVISAYIRGRGL